MKTLLTFLCMLFFIPVAQQCNGDDEHIQSEQIVRAGCYQEHASSYNFSLYKWEKDTVYYKYPYVDNKVIVDKVMQKYAEYSGIYLIPTKDRPDILISLSFIDGHGTINKDGFLQNTLGLSDFPPANSRGSTIVHITLDSLDLAAMEGATGLDFFHLANSISFHNGKIMSLNHTMPSL